MKNRQQNIEAIYWSKIKRGESYKCWPWIGAPSDEYGAFWDGSRVVGAHRYAWEIT